MSKGLLEEVAENVGADREMVSAICDELMLQLHRRLFEYRGLNGDYVGEELHWQLGPQGYYHFLGFLDTFADRYSWEPGSAGEYLARLGTRSEWLPFRHQMEGWRKPGE